MRYNPPQPKDKFPTEEIWKDKELCKKFAKDKSLEDWYLDHLIKERKDRIELLEEFNVELKDKEQDILLLQQQGKAVMIVVVNNKIVGLVGLGDTLKENSKVWKRKNWQKNCLKFYKFQ